MLRQDNLLKYYKTRIMNIPSDDDIKFVPEISHFANIYQNDDVPKEISFTVETDLKGTFLAEFELEGPFEARVNLGKQTIENGQKVSVKLPDLSENFGVFYLDITASYENGEVAAEETIPFSHLRVGAGQFKKCGASAHIAGGIEIADSDCFFRNKTADLMRIFGAAYLRTDADWKWCEIEKGVVKTPVGISKPMEYVYSTGIKPTLNLLYGNDFYDEGSSPYTEEGLAAFVRFCVDVATTLKGKVFTYEIWNEFNSGFSRKDSTPEEYAWILKSVYPALKAVDSNIEVFAGVTVGTQPEWIRRILRAGAYDYFDGISYHPYCTNSYPDENQGCVERNARTLKNVLCEFGGEKPVFASEIGWAVNNERTFLNREQQAAALSRLFAITECSEDLDRLTFYDIRNDTSNYFDTEPNWGAIEFEDCIVPFAVKESFAAISFLNYMICNAEYKNKEVVKDIKTIRYSENGKTINHIWSLDGRKKVTLNLNEKCDLYDMYGSKVKSDIPAGEYTLEINENPIYLAGGKTEVLTVLKPDKLIYDFPYTVTAVPVLKDDGWYVSAVIHCHTRKLFGRLRIEMPELSKSGFFSQFKLKEGEKFSTEIKVGNVDPKKLYRAVMELFLSTGENKIITELVSFLSVPYKNNYTEIVLNTKNDYVCINGAKPMQAEARVKLSYTEEYLMLNVDVEEETHIQYAQASNDWKDLWDGDGIELMLQPLYDGNPQLTKYNHIGLALSSFSGEKIPWLWKSVSNRGSQRFYNCDLNIKREGHLTKYTAKFNWKDILPPNVEYTDCDSFGFALKVNKTDDPEVIKGFLPLYRGIGWWQPPYQNSYLPCEFGRFVLGKKE